MAVQIADLFEHVVDVVPERPALIAGEVRYTYAELDAEANRFAHHLLGAGIEPGEHVGLMARNVAEHVVAMLGCFKARVVPINVNYRYLEAELDHLFENSGIVGLVHEDRYAPVLAGVVSGHEHLRHVMSIRDGSGESAAYESIDWRTALDREPATRGFGERSADDVLIIYTGGTTGYPKGVVWRQEDAWRALGGGTDFATREPIEEFAPSRAAAENPSPLVSLQLGPIMHASGQWAMLMRFITGQTNVLLPKFDPPTIWRTFEAERINTISLVGDAMARPLIEEFERGAYDGSTLTTATSAAALFSVEVKERWIKAFPDAVVLDVIGSSETGMTGNGRIEHETLADKGSLVHLGPGTAVVDERHRIIDPSEVGAIGLMARSGTIPIGYLGDPEKTARTFIEIDGIRYAVPGDYVQIEEGHRLTLLGRGTGCINTGGEKVFPEEVEVALKSHPGVFDTLVFALPDPTYGQQVAALIEPRPGVALDVEGVRAHLRTRLSGYKVPRTVHVVEKVPRHVTGKADYRRAREISDALCAEKVS
ncbi:acyl-CoA synthetase [Nocardioides sp. NPDC127503]|uniref:acyl-CoA synthetase n=1 Tax=Nocardioides sp. NPDC127503 TaxID=3154516 RepID=UPI0033206D47